MPECTQRFGILQMADVEDLHDVSEFHLEYKSKDDDAWYSVRVVLSDGNSDNETTLTVKFQGFTAACDEKYNVGQFQAVAEVEEFMKRFRPVSEQLQDRECRKVFEGMKVCASLSCLVDDLRYYDAVVEAVNQQAHIFTNEEEECMCTFILFWLHGPSSGNLTSASIENICTIQAAVPVDPKISAFSKLAKQRIETASIQYRIASEPHASVSRGPQTCEVISCLSYNLKSSSESRCQENGTSNGGGVKLQNEGFSSSGRACRYGEKSDCDEDLGGNDFAQSDGLHFVLIDNLETDLSPSSIWQFIQEYTFISPEAYVFPSRSSVPYASGAIVLDSETKLEKIFEFLINPEHIIVSGRGRPWVVTEKMSRQGTFGSTTHILTLEYQGEFQKSNINRELKVVHSGTEAYKKAKQLRELFMDFVDHEKRLHKRLAFEETRILQSPY